MYFFDSRIRFSEVDEEGCLAIWSLVDYFQDCSTFQSEDLGVGMMYLRENHQVWVLSSWQIEIGHMPMLGDAIRIGTLPYDFKGFMGMRNFWIENEQGERIAMANSYWSLLDTETGRPVRIPQKMIDVYTPEEKLDMEYLPRKILCAENYRTGEPIVIQKHHLDTNHHVNNGQYIRMALDSVGEMCKIKRIRVEYRKQVYLGDVLLPCITWEEKRCVVALKDAGENICCMLEFEVR